jgi:hypothetical protein
MVLARLHSKNNIGRGGEGEMKMDKRKREIKELEKEIEILEMIMDDKAKFNTMKNFKVPFIFIGVGVILLLMTKITIILGIIGIVLAMVGLIIDTIKERKFKREYRLKLTKMGVNVDKYRRYV